MVIHGARIKSFKKLLAYYTLLVYDLEFTTRVGLQPRVYYNLTNSRRTMGQGVIIRLMVPL